MQRWFEFMGNHPFLFGTLGALIVLFFAIESKRNGKKIAPSELGLLVNNQNARVVDIRPKAQFANGHIQGSQNIPFGELTKNLDELKNRAEPLIFVCDMGMQSGAAAALIGKDNVYRLDGGIQAWRAGGMPLVGQKAKKS